MAAPSSTLKDLLPLLFLVLLVALVPPLGVILICMGVVMNWSKKAAGTWPWHGRFWDEMGYTVGGALGIIIVGLVLNQLVVDRLLTSIRALFA